MHKKKDHSIRLSLFVLLFLCIIGSIVGLCLVNTMTRNYSSTSDQTIYIKGSATVNKIINYSATSFMEAHSGINVNISSVSSTSGLNALIQQACHIATSSQPITTSMNQSANGQLRTFTLAKEVATIIVNNATNTLDLTPDEIRAIFNGTISDWSHPAVSEAGLTGAIQVIIREPDAITRNIFNKFIMGDEDQQLPGSQYTVNAIQMESNLQVKAAVITNPNYIGYIGFGWMDWPNYTVKPVRINGFEPSSETILNGSYIAQKDLFFTTLGEASGLIREFINWHLSPDGQYWVNINKFVCVAPAARRQPSPDPTPHETITLEGSVLVYDILNDSKKTFEAIHPELNVILSATDSDSGISGLINGQHDVAMSSRYFSLTENDLSGERLQAYSIAKEAIVIILHSAANPLSISSDIARAIFNGTISDWSHPDVAEAGLTGTIQVVTRDSGSRTRILFDKLVMGDEDQQLPGSQYTGDAIQKGDNQLVIDAVMTNSTYIGYTDYRDLNSSVNVALINNVLPSYETIQTEHYSLQNDLFLITLDKPSGLIREVINWHLSPDGQYWVCENGFLNIAAKSNTIPSITSEPLPTIITSFPSSTPTTSEIPFTPTSGEGGISIGIGIPLVLTVIIGAMTLAIAAPLTKKIHK